MSGYHRENKLNMLLVEILQIASVLTFCELADSFIKDIV